MALTPGDTNYQNYVNRICYTKTQLDSGVLDSRYFAESEFLAASAGVGSAGKPVKLNSSGLIDATMMSGGSVATHAALTAAHGATGAVVGTTNTQTLTNKTLTAATLSGQTTLDLANFYLSSANTNTDPLINLDSNDYLIYTRSTNILGIVVGSAERFSVSATTAAITGNATVSGTLAVTGSILNPTITTPTIASFVNANHTHIATGSTGGAVAHSVLTGAGTNAHSLIDAHLAASTGVHGTSGAVVGTTDTQTLTNKTLTSPIISTISNTGTLTLPTSTDTLVGKATTDTLTNKSLTSPTLSGTVSATGVVNFTGTVSETANSTDNVRIGVIAGVPRIIWEDNTFTQWEMDNSAGTLRILTPGVVQAQFGTSGKFIIGGSTQDHQFEIKDTTGGGNYRLTAEVNSGGTGLNTINSYSTGTGTFTVADLSITGSRIKLIGARVNLGLGGTPTSGVTSGVAGDMIITTTKIWFCTDGANTWKGVAIA